MSKITVRVVGVPNYGGFYDSTPELFDRAVSDYLTHAPDGFNWVQRTADELKALVEDQAGEPFEGEMSKGMALGILASFYADNIY